MSENSAIIEAVGLALRIEGELGAFRVSLSAQEVEPGVAEVTVLLSADAAAAPPVFRLVWNLPAIDVQGSWWTGARFDRGLTAHSHKPSFVSRATHDAPVIALYSVTGENRLTFACSDALNDIEVEALLVEESAELRCLLGFFTRPHPPLDRYVAVVRLDRRALPFHAALDEVGAWWSAMPAYRPSAVPDVARLPVYSTWYSFHQRMTEDELVAQCELARPMGMDAIIIDDGWQTLDSARGYAYVGDWQPERLTKMRDMVDRIHALDMKALLWYAVPLVGRKSDAFRRWKDKLLYPWRIGADVVDPRYPDVREWLIGLYERALREWNLDGLKLDFTDLFVFEPELSRPGDSPGMDHASVAQAADRLLTDVLSRVRAIKPEAMVEFRQPYVGPLMRKYGNMFRAGDAPNDPLVNRIRTLELRLLAGDTAPHSDMVMWHAGEPVQRAALHLLAVLFSVPQISMRLERLPEPHAVMLRDYLRFWREHRATLLDGELTLGSPVANYPWVIARGEEGTVAAVYAPDVVLPIAAAFSGPVTIFNATGVDRVMLSAPPLTGRRYRVVDCLGQLRDEATLATDAKLTALPVPVAGRVVFESN